MKNLLLIAAFILSSAVYAQITLNNSAPASVNITENYVLFNPNYLSFYIRVDDYKIEPFKITKLEQEYTTVALEYSNLRPHEKSIPLYTINIRGTHKNNGIKNVFFKFQFTNLEAFLATISLLESYDRKGKLILSKAPVSVNIPTQLVTIPGSEKPKPIFPIKNDIIEYIHKGSTNTF